MSKRDMGNKSRKSDHTQSGQSEPSKRAAAEWVPLAKLRGWAQNPKQHPPAQVADIAASIKRFGWGAVILARPDGDGGGEIIAGHGRALAAEQLKLAHVPVRWMDLSDPVEAHLMALADNRLTEVGVWDESLLGDILRDAAKSGASLEGLGWSEDQLAELMAPPENAGLTDPDDAPDPPVHPRSVPGDLCVLGRHRIICGDSTSADAVGRLLAGVSPHLMVTDHPYGVSYDPAAARETGVAMGKVLNDDRADWSEAWALFPGDVAYVYHGGLHSHVVIASLQASGFDLRAQIIWNKGRPVIGRGHYHWQHEPCLYAVRRGRTGHWAGDRKQTTVWDIAHARSETGHGTQKPVECMRRPMENNSSPGQAVYEPFSGSGTSIIAAEMTGRACYAVELSPAYVDVAVKRCRNSLA